MFIDDGKVTAVGTHDSLYETCPSYRNMVDLQRLDEEQDKKDTEAEVTENV